MNYILNFKNKKIKLPKCTLKIEETVEELTKYQEKEIKKEITKRDLIKKELQFIELIIGEKEAKNLLNFNNIEDVDTKEVEILVFKICNTYGSYITNAKLKETIESFSDFANSENIKKITNLFNQVNYR